MNIKHSNKLCSEPKYNVILNKYVNYIRDENYDSNTNFPRYEEYSLLSRNLPFCTYDNEVFTQMTTDTAFTTGEAIFIHKDMFQKLIDLDNELIASNKANLANNVIFVLLHEVAHCLNDDLVRLAGVKEPIPNIAQDIANNQTLCYQLGIEIDLQAFENKIGFPILGLTKEDKKYIGMSSESIAIDIVKDALSAMKQQNSQQQSSQQQSSQQQSSQQQSSQQQSGQQNGNQSDISKPSSLTQSIIDKMKEGSNESAVDDHKISHNDVAQAAQEAGIAQQTLDRLKLKPRTIEEIEAISADNAMRAQQVAQEMDTIHSGLSEQDKSQTMAGTSGGYYKRKAKLGDEGSITWRVAVSESFDPGNTQQTQYTEDELIDEYFSIPSMYNGVFYSVDQKPGCAIFLIDTSGSMNRKFIDQLFTEALSSVDLEDPSSGFSQILLFPADVDVKDVYWSLTPENKEQVISEVMDYGGGGTDFTNPIRNSLLKAEELELKVHTVVFGTDLGAPTPNFGYIEDQLEDGEMPPVIFITDRDERSAKEFEKDCEGRAVVYSYSNDLELVLADINEELDDQLQYEHNKQSALISSSLSDDQIIDTYFSPGM
ncbi:conserved hypothetical protein [Vibrio chagasii]|nr:conserved hypothetical protein [Vibrio chagasii]CAH6949940.1 conserved hypothetical protein [Vibrio chagasii]